MGNIQMEADQIRYKGQYRTVQEALDNGGGGGGGGPKKYIVTIVTKSTGDDDAALTVTQYSGGIEINRTTFSHRDNPIVISDFLRIEYGELKFKYTLLRASDDHESGYSEDWSYSTEVSITESYTYEIPE